MKGGKANFDTPYGPDTKGFQVHVDPNDREKVPEKISERNSFFKGVTALTTIHNEGQM